MPNLLMTQKCVRRCPYCFADKYMEGGSGEFLGWNDFIYVLDFYERNGLRNVSMLGGEPTIHPDIDDMADYALQRGFDVRMFTSGIMGEKTRQRMAAVWERHPREGAIHFVVNTNHPSDTPPAELKSQVAFLEAAGRRASLSFNIYKSDFDLGFAFDHVLRYGLTKTIRLGLAHPIASAMSSNLFVPPERYREVADQLLRFQPQFEAAGVKPGFDCGFPLCMFDDAQLGALVKLGSTFNWTCGPVIDIGPDLEIWPCFPLTHVRGKSLYDFDTLQEINDYFTREIREKRGGNTGVFVECDDCTHRDRNQCGGGCVTYAIPEASIEANDPSRRPLRTVA